MLNKYKNLFLVFIIFLIILSIMQFTVPHIIGFDGYSHIKTADIMKKEGFFKEFPWATHTILTNNYADIQVLFRLLLIPFTFLGLELGAKIASIIFSAAAFTVFYWFLIENRIKYAFFWSLLYLFTAASLMQRFLLPRQMPLVIALLILTIYFLQKKKYLFLGMTSLVFALLHSSFVIQLIIILLYSVLGIIFSKKFDYKILLYAIIGTVLGLVINPYFPNNISFLYTQIFQVNLLANLFNVEWKPWSFFEFIKNNILVLIYISVTIIVLIKNKKISQTKLYFLLLALFFFVYTILSRRMQEYLVPFSILALVFILKDYFEGIDKHELFKFIKIGSVGFLVIVAGINFLILRNNVINNDFLYNYENCADWMSDNIPKNSLVFNNAYAFNYLFFKNHDLRYTHGIDLTYSYLFDDEEFERYMGILRGTIVTNADIIIDDYSPDYLFVGKVEQDVKLFDFIIKNKENYKSVYEDDWCAVLKVS